MLRNRRCLKITSALGLHREFQAPDRKSANVRGELVRKFDCGRTIQSMKPPRSVVCEENVIRVASGFWERKIGGREDEGGNRRGRGRTRRRKWTKRRQKAPLRGWRVREQGQPKIWTDGVVWQGGKKKGRKSWLVEGDSGRNDPKVHRKLRSATCGKHFLNKASFVTIQKHGKQILNRRWITRWMSRAKMVSNLKKNLLGNVRMNTFQHSECV